MTDISASSSSRRPAALPAGPASASATLGAGGAAAASGLPPAAAGDPGRQQATQFVRVEANPFGAAPGSAEPAATPAPVHPSVAAAAAAAEWAQPGLAAPPAAGPSAGKTPEPVRPGSATTLQELKADPRVKGRAQIQLGRLIQSKGFQALDARGQQQALGLYKANLDDVGALDRVFHAVGSLWSVRSADAKVGALQALQQGSPLTPEKLERFRGLIGPPPLSRFKDLGDGEQAQVVAALKAAAAEPGFMASLKGLTEDPRFRALPPSERSAVLDETVRLPDARAVELLQANLGDSASLRRSHEALGALGGIRQLETRLQVVDALRRCSPIQDETLRNVKSLFQAPGFLRLDPKQQDCVAHAFTSVLEDPPTATGNVEAFRRLLEHPWFQAVKPAHGQTRILERIQDYPDHRTVRLFEANLADETVLGRAHEAIQYLEMSSIPKHKLPGYFDALADESPLTRKRIDRLLRRGV
jgi:hypothetical protein